MSNVDVKITASAKIHGQEVKDIPVVNPGGWFGKTWLVEIGGSYTPLFLIVEADNPSDAIDELCDDPTYGHEIHVDDTYLDDYPENDRHYAGNDCRVVDLDWVMIHGREDYTTKQPYVCTYFGHNCGAAGVSPLIYNDDE